MWIKLKEILTLCYANKKDLAQTREELRTIRQYPSETIINSFKRVEITKKIIHLNLKFHKYVLLRISSNTSNEAYQF